MTLLELWKELTDDEKYECVWWLDISKWNVFNYAHQQLDFNDEREHDFLKMVDIAKDGWEDLSENAKNFLQHKAEDDQSGH